MHWTLQGALWLLGAVLEWILAITLLQRGLHKEYPLFFSYLALEMVREIVLAGLPRHHPPYFYAYWMSECLVALFGFLVVEEVFRKAFEKRLGLQKLGTTLFRCSLLALIITAVVVAALAPGKDSDKLIAAILVLKRTQSFVRLGLVGCLFAFVYLLGLAWGNYSVGIAIGFAVYGIVEFAVMLARSHYGSAVNDIWVWSIIIVGVFQLLIWVVYFLRGQPLRPRTLIQEKVYSDLPVAAEVSKMNDVVDSLLGR